jgi:hypothetical protein
MAVTRFPLAKDVINQAASELGLGQVGDPFQAPDPKWAQLISLLSKVGQKLALGYAWSQLRTEWVFNTQAGDTGIYLIPADFIDMVDQTGWNRTSRLPLGGPLSAQEWQYVQAWAMGLTITVLFRQNATELWLYPQPPPAGVKIAMEYRSSSWVAPAASVGACTANNYKTLGPVNGSDTPAAAGDLLLFDKLLLVAKLKAAFLSEKGMDTTKADEEADDLYEKCTARQANGQVLSLNGPRLGIPGARLIGNANLPPTGYGQ